MDAFERLNRALTDLMQALWDALCTPFEWLMSRPIIVIIWLAIVAVLIALDLLTR